MTTHQPGDDASSYAKIAAAAKANGQPVPEWAGPHKPLLGKQTILASGPPGTVTRIAGPAPGWRPPDSDGYA